MLAEDLSVLFADFGVPVSFGAQSTTGILDMPTEVVAGGMILSTDYQLTFRTSTLTITGGDTITVNAATYYVREVRLQDDGALSVAYLSKA